MTDIDTEHRDVAWKSAVDWLMLAHENPLCDKTLSNLREWLEASPVNRQAYDQANALWLTIGLIPTSEESKKFPLDDN